ncbi:MAG: acyl-CoA thioesterase [Acidimicrobiales bacterium]|nr:acyl-CoA thioesterase [Acidimicrobiales bacterium]
MPHRTPIKVRFYELDPYGHLNHAVYVNHFEVGRVECLESLGWGLDALLQQGYQLVVTELTTRFLRSAGPGDRLVVETELADLARASSRWRQRIVRDTTDEVLATQELRAAVTDLRGRPTRVPADFAAALATLCA